MNERKNINFKRLLIRNIKKFLILIITLSGFVAFMNIAWLGPWLFEPNYWKPHLNYGDNLTTIYVVTKTPVPCKLKVVWWVENNSNWEEQISVEDATERLIHELPLENLTPNHSIKYHLEPVAGYEGELSEKIIADLKRDFIIPGNAIIAKDTTDPIYFAVYGDNRPNIFGTSNHRYLVSAIYDKKPQFVLQMGDIVQTGQIDMEWARFFTTGEKILRSIPLMPSLGNHEYYAGSEYNQHTVSNASNYLDAFKLPGNESYYAYNVSRTHFISLDISSSSGAKGDQIQANQMIWLDNHLASLNKSDFDWLIVFFHYPIISSGENHENIWSEILGPVFNKYNLTVDMFLVGHVHQYERLYYNVSKSWIILNAGGGAEIEQWKATGSIRDDSKCIELSHSFSTIEINGLNLTLRAYFMNGKQFDELKITKSAGGL
ncbi:MAG: metallophosphoesterase family protein [Promethearchaeota archaeon]